MNCVSKYLGAGIIFALLVIIIARFFRSGLWGLLVWFADRYNTQPDGNQAQDKGTLDNVVS